MMKSILAIARIPIVGLGIFFGSSSMCALAGPFPDPGPGFDASNVRVDAEASAGETGDQGVTSVPGGIASANVDLGEFWNASASAQGNTMTGNGVTDVNGGIGAVGAGGDVELGFRVLNDPNKIPIPFIVSATTTATASFLPTADPIVGTVSVDAVLEIASDLQSEVVHGVLDANSDGTHPPNPTINNGFNVTLLSANTPGIFGQASFTTEIDTTSLLIVDLDFTGAAEQVGVITSFTLDGLINALEVAPGYDGPPPIVEGPGGVIFQVPQAPEPDMIATFVLGLIATCGIRRCGRSNARID